ncbi:uncharacterized protein N7498_001864 [Penicillium cinerascens]|uniref:HAUS augmin-like complex subunit 6 N-terminal domain-containing protein n=1 Tax=Penicillium cinerascens TaxID=70096 RepID=A0A9W9N905_9EURO|nr:uncharacterized protein N7498_001864 [Penicillium cinerascens]KAJ5215457.1 hypothetical protein N7498_001864 [Penicillium cinerascens]
MATSRPARPKPFDWSAPSHLTVFIRNLKLLQLDQREDWPDITLRSLSPSSQNQRQRIRLVEWALYYLCTIWDPKSAQHKLRPFFPPLEHLQSVNLRAALFRVLTELKKNGDLGREAVIRKTMLDDCKGEKFHELLAVFSTAVLRKLVAVSSGEMNWNLAMKLSTASSITPKEYQNLLPLILAHQVSLNAAGACRARVHQSYDQFSRLLDDKKTELVERAKKPANDKDHPTVDSEGLTRELQANWLGSAEWATALLDGGSQSSTDAFLELPFSQAWARATASSVDGLGTGAKPDLVVDLETRVLHLRSRLRRWHQYNASLRKARGGSPSSMGAEAQEPRLLFRDHQALTVASISKAVRQPGDRGRVLKKADESFMSTVNEAVSRINGQSRSNSRDILAVVTEGKKPAPLDKMTTDRYNKPPSPNSDTELPKQSLNTDSPDPILASEGENSQPTPVVRFSPDQDSENEPDPEPVKNTSTSHYTLAERTRKSMSLVPPLPTHEAQTRPRRRGPRTSFPVKQFERPRKSSRPSGGRSGASTPQDKLFEEDAEYASVFKSRPRVALSPISSPAVHISPSLGEDEFELDEDDGAWGDVDSPLATSRMR